MAWLGATLATAGLAAATTELLVTDGVTPPALAAGPLAVYLLSLVIAFSTRGERLVRPARLLAPIAAIVLLVPWAFRPDWPALTTALVVLTALLVLALAIHLRLAADRPARIQLTRFYRAMATGAMLGTTIVVLIAPVALAMTYEYPIFVAAALFALADLHGRQLASGATEESPPRSIRAVRRLLPYFAATVVAIFAIVLIVAPPTGLSIAQARNLLGVVRVEGDGAVHREYVGTALRGSQFLDGRSSEPTGAYTRTGPLGQAFDEARAAAQHPTVAVVGLGVGAVAAYARDVDRFTFFEADETIADIANDPRLFTYLSSAPIAPKLVLGDPRRSLEAAAPASYNLVIVDLDASSSNAGGPERLLSREALSTYAQALRSGGFIVYHLPDSSPGLTSNIMSTARSLGFSTLEKNQQPDPGRSRVPRCTTVDLGGRRLRGRGQALRGAGLERRTARPRRHGRLTDSSGPIEHEGWLPDGPLPCPSLSPGTQRKPMNQRNDDPTHRPLRATGLAVPLTLLLVAVAACGSNKSPAEQAQAELSAGLAADTAGNIGDAAVHYRSCLTFEPTNKFCIFNLGVQAQNAGRSLEAELVPARAP